MDYQSNFPTSGVEIESQSKRDSATFDLRSPRAWSTITIRFLTGTTLVGI